jgi:hypothetical protein
MTNFRQNLPTIFMSRLFYLFIIVALGSCKRDSLQDEIIISDFKIANVGLASAVAEANLTVHSSQPVIEKGFCWSSSTAHLNIDSNNTLVSLRNGNQFTDTIKGLKYNTKYYVRAFAKNVNGIFYSKTDSFSTQNTTFTIGQTYKGGYVFYIDSTGEHGLIAARTYGHARWGAWWTRFLFLGTSKSFGTGQANTQFLIDTAGNDVYAAKYCYDLVFDGYDDWFLPSDEELYVLKVNLQPTGFLNIYPGDIYWSSSEVEYPGYQFAVWISVINGMASFSSEDKQFDHGVIPVRKF